VSPGQISNRWIEHCLGLRQLLVAEVEGRLVGTVSISPSATPPGLHLFALEVAPAWRGQGIGGQIVEHVVAEAVRRGLPCVFLEVRVDNPARRLYHRLGFRRVGEAFMNYWWRFQADGSRERVEELTYRMVRRVRTAEGPA
jgi:ribosomal protein S18 acetylase RimI-like enzyme